MIISKSDYIKYYQCPKEVWLYKNRKDLIPEDTGEQELDENSTIRNFRTVQKEASREVARDIKHYNLDAILVGK
ncbi:virulence RhuM family protein [Patescibacteria group bacterium]|nr:virulence RhuM family protein [Patescibacteria group bacterium]